MLNHFHFKNVRFLTKVTEQTLIITPKRVDSIYEVLESDEDLINLVEGDTYIRVWSDGEFEVDQHPKIQHDGSIILPTDSVVRLSNNIQTNIDIDLDGEDKQEKFWKTHTVSHYIIKNGFRVETKL